MITRTPEFRHLLELGRRRGYVTVDEVKAALPVGHMTQEEVTEAVRALERHDVTVEVDEALTRRRGAEPERAAEAPEGRPDPVALAAAERAREPLDMLPVDTRDVHAPELAGHRPGGKPVPVNPTALVMVALLGAVVILLLVTA